jgi:hypothetical protein
VLAGFRKDRQELLFLSFGGDQDAAKAWLSDVLPRIATTAHVTTFNEAFSAARSTSRGDDPQSLAAGKRRARSCTSPLLLPSGRLPARR